MFAKSLFLALLTCSLAPRSFAQVVQTSNGPVEFIGLKKWTPERIVSALGYKSNDDLEACALVLKKKLNFAQTAVFTHRNEPYTVVAVIEPEEKARVRLKPNPSMSILIPAPWHPMVDLVSSGKMFAQRDAWLNLLKERRTEEDYRCALEVLSSETNKDKRVVAGQILRNFPERDQTFYALIDGLLDPQTPVCTACMDSLFVLKGDGVPSRTIDWSPVSRQLRLLFDGTDIFGLPVTIQTLLKYGANRELGKETLGEGAEMLVNFVDIKHPFERDLAHDLLVRLSGQDSGMSSAPWRTWISTHRELEHEKRL